MLFNINNIVKVKLNEYGERIIKEKHDHLNAIVNEMVGKEINLLNSRTHKDSEGYSEFQLWELMSIFGQYLSMVGNAPFDTVIKIPENKE